MSGVDRTVRRNLILPLCALALVLDGFDTQVIGFAAPSLLADWQVSKADLAPILGLGLLGMSLGAAAGGYAGDRFGRRVGMIASTIVFGLATLAMAGAGSLPVLAGLRLLAGVGLGGALPIAAALVAEFAPPNRRSLAVALSIICIPVGGILGGFLAAVVLPATGWRGLFVLAGSLPLAVALVHVLALPESPSFVRARQARQARQHAAQVRSAPGAAPAPRTAGFFRTIAALRLRRDTFALWGGFGASLLSGYLYFNWLPVLLAESGFALRTTSVGLLVYNVGCVAAGICAGALAIRLGNRKPLLALAAGGAAGAMVLMFAMPSPRHADWLMAALAVQGFCLGGVQVLLYAMAVQVFPAAIRATGIGGAASVGRIGAIVSSGLGAAVLAWHAFGFFLSIALGQALCILCVLLVSRQDTQPDRAMAAET